MAKKNLQAIDFSETGTAAEEKRAGKKNLPSLPAPKTQQTTETPAIVKAVVKRLQQRPSQEASAAFDRYVQPDHTVAILTGRKSVTQNQADAARKEYEDYVAANPIPYVSSGVAANNPLTATLDHPKQDTDSPQYRQTQLLKQKADEAKREAENAADALTYETDMRRINALPKEVRNALLTYTQARPNVLNPAEYSAGVRIQSKKRLEEAGLSNDEIDALSETYARHLNQAEAQKAARLAKQHTDDGIGGTLWGNALSVGGNLVSGITGTADVLMEGAGRLLTPNDRYHNLDPNLPGFLPSVYSGAVRQETAQNIEGYASDSPLRRGVGKAGSMLYQAAMSGMDNLARAATGPGGALALAGASSFQNAVRETTLKGGTPQQAYAMGVAQAGLEILTEKVSIDKLFSTPTPENVAQLLKNAAVQGAVEMTEEEMNFAGGLIADAVIMGKNSDYNRAVQELVSGGMSYEQAKQQAQIDVLYQALETAAQSFLSGSMTSGTRGAFEYMVSKSQTAQDAADFTPEDQTPTAEEMVAEPLEGFTEKEIKATPDAQPVDKIETLKRDIRSTLAKLIPQQQNAIVEKSSKDVDANIPEGYNNTINQGGNNNAEYRDDRTTGTGNSAQGLAGVQSSNGSEIAGGNQHGGVVEHVGILRVSDSLQKAQSKRGTATYTVYDTTASPAEYAAALVSGRNSDTVNGWCVTPKSGRELAEGNVRTFMNENRTVGLGVAPDGDIVAVFKNRNGGPRKALDTAMPLAIEMGGDRLDCYGEGLVTVYEGYGFVPVARVEFNPEYANEGWSPEKGSPYIYVMMHNGDPADVVASKMHTYKLSTKAELNALPTYGKDDYDAAMEYRNNLISQNRETESVGAAPQGFDPYSNLQYQHGNQSDRANDARAVNVPKKDTYGRHVSEFAANAYGAEAIPDSFIPVIEQLIQDGAMGHDRRTNAESLRMAAAEIAKSEAAVRNDIRESIITGRIGDSDIAAAMLLVTKDANSGNMDSASELMVDLKEMGTRSGRNLQLFKLLRRLTPEGQYMTVEKTVRRFIDDVNKRRSKRKQVDVQIPQELIDDYLNAVRQESTAPQTPDIQPAAPGTDSQTTPDVNPAVDSQPAAPDSRPTPDAPTAPSVDEAEDAIYEFVASQIPATLQEKWDSWRYMAMLGNPKTQIRNMAGNLIFSPFVEAKRYLGATAEAMVIKDRNQRTKAILGNSEADQALKAWADIDARRMVDSGRMDYTASTGDSAANTIEEKRTIFKNKALEAARTGLSDLMGAEDMIFKRWEYKTSLASFLKARGCTADQLMAGQVSESLLEEARSYAVQEAMKATFNDRNAVSDFVVGLRFKGHNPVSRAANAMMEGVLPFRRTPANIVVRAAEYSPAGLGVGIWNAATKVKSGEMTAADAIDQISSGLVGTGAMALGYALASGIFGVRLVGNEDDEDELRAGHQSYALEIGNQSYTIDWAAPACLPLFMGANLYASLNPDGEETSVSALTAFLDTCANTFEPMLELSCLSSLNDLIQDTRYAEEGRELYTILASMATNYLMQGLPTLFGQVEQTFEDKKKTVYSNNSDPVLRQLERTVGRATQKIPGIDLFQAERLDEWGNSEPEKNVFQKGVKAFISPGYHSEISTNPVEAELSRLNKSQSENVAPSDAARTIRFTDSAGKSQNVRFTPEQWEMLQKTQGHTAHRVISDLISSEDYDLLNDAQKAAAIDAAHAYARETARVSHVDSYPGMSAKWMEGIEGQEAATILERVKADASGLSDSQYATAKELGISFGEMQNVSSKVRATTAISGTTSKYDTYRAALQSVPEEQREAWLKTYGMSDSQLESYREAVGAGVKASDFVDYLEASAMLDKAFADYSEAWEDGRTTSVRGFTQAYQAFLAIPEEGRKYFREKLNGRAGAFLDAMEAGVSYDAFMNLYRSYRQIDDADTSKSVKADNWAAALDKAVEQGKLTKPQRQTMWNSLGYYTQLRQDAQKYHDLTSEGLSSDVALLVRRTLAGLKPEEGRSTVRAVQQYEAIVQTPDLTNEQQLAALYAYGNDAADENLDEALSLGLDAQRYVEAYRMYLDTSGKGKMARTIKQYQDAFGLDYDTAKALYEIYA